MKAAETRLRKDWWFRPCLSIARERAIAAMVAFQPRLNARPSQQAVVTATGGYRVRSPLFMMNTNCQKRLRLLSSLCSMEVDLGRLQGSTVIMKRIHIALGGRKSLLW